MHCAKSAVDSYTLPSRKLQSIIKHSTNNDYNSYLSLSPHFTLLDSEFE